MKSRDGRSSSISSTALPSINFKNLLLIFLCCISIVDVVYVIVGYFLFALFVRKGLNGKQYAGSSQSIVIVVFYQ